MRPSSKVARFCKAGGIWPRHSTAEGRAEAEGLCSFGPSLCREWLSRRPGPSACGGPPDWPDRSVGRPSKPVPNLIILLEKSASRGQSKGRWRAFRDMRAEAPDLIYESAVG